MIEICLFIKNGNWYKQKQALLLNIQKFFLNRGLITQKQIIKYLKQKTNEFICSLQKYIKLIVLKK